MVDHCGQVIKLVTVFINAAVLYLLPYDAVGVMNDDNLINALETQIKVSIFLIGMVRTPSIMLLVK